MTEPVHYLSATALRQKILKRELSCEEVMRAHLERIEAVTKAQRHCHF